MTRAFGKERDEQVYISLLHHSPHRLNDNGGPNTVVAKCRLPLLALLQDTCEAIAHLQNAAEVCASAVTCMEGARGKAEQVERHVGVRLPGARPVRPASK